MPIPARSAEVSHLRMRSGRSGYYGVETGLGWSSGLEVPATGLDDQYQGL